MTHIELRDAIKTRIGFSQEAGAGFTLTAPNTTTVSGRFYQDEHPFVTVMNIEAFQYPVSADDTAFNTYLTQLRERCAMGVVTDVIETTEVPADYLTNRESIFDNALIKKMGIIIAEIMLTSQRSNSAERVGKDFMRQLFFELNGNTGNPQLPQFQGLRGRYKQEVQRLKDLLGHRKTLSTYTHRVLDKTDDNIVKF